MLTSICCQGTDVFGCCLKNRGKGVRTPFLDGCVGDGFGTEPEQGLIFLQERLHGPVGIVGVEHLRRGWSDKIPPGTRCRESICRGNLESVGSIARTAGRRAVAFPVPRRTVPRCSRAGTRRGVPPGLRWPVHTERVSPYTTIFMLEMLKAQGQSLNIRLILAFSIQHLTFSFRTCSRNLI
jgi:hypothetical protein